MSGNDTKMIQYYMSRGENAGDTSNTPLSESGAPFIA